MSFWPEQKDYNAVFQAQKRIFGKVEILNSNFQVVDSIEGLLISDNYNSDASSNIRRTYSCTLKVTSTTIDFNGSGDFWFNKYVRPYVGIYSNTLGETLWYLKGTFSSANATHQYNISTNTLSVSCNDMMCRLTGEMDGVQRDMTGTGFTIPQGTDIRNAIIATIAEFGFSKYKIDTLPRQFTTYDLEFSTGASAYSTIESLLQFEANYEFYFDIDGTFVVQKIPCYTDAPDSMPQTYFTRALVSQDSYTVNFTAKNCVEVWGKSWGDDNVDRVADGSNYQDNVYTITIEDWIKDEAFVVTKCESMEEGITVDVDKSIFCNNITNESNGYKIIYNSDDQTWSIYMLIQNDEELLEDDQLIDIVPFSEAKESWGITCEVPSGSHLYTGDFINVTVVFPNGIPYNYFVFSNRFNDTNEDNCRITIVTNRIINFPSKSEFPSGGRTDKYYRDLSNGKIYYWDEDDKDYYEISEDEYDDISHGPYDVVDDYDRNIKEGTIQDGNMYVFEYLDIQGYEYRGIVSANNLVKISSLKDSSGKSRVYSFDTSGYVVGERITAKLNTSSGQPATYTVTAIQKAGKILFLSGLTAHATYEHHDDSYITDIPSRFTVENMGKEYWTVLSGGEYEGIMSDTLARERAMYECYYKANLNETLSLTLLDIPWLEVNTRVTYQRIGATEPERWIIQSISSETSNGTCSVSLVRFYPDWSEIFREEYI